MTNFSYYTCLLAFLFRLSVPAHAGDFIRTADGVIVYPDAPFSANAKEMQLKVIADNIIRIIGVADKYVVPSKSLIITAGKTPDVKWDITNTRVSVSIITSKLIALVDLHTGAVT